MTGQTSEPVGEIEDIAVGDTQSLNRRPRGGEPRPGMQHLRRGGAGGALPGGHAARLHRRV